jgi:hypothetical protein
MKSAWVTFLFNVSNRELDRYVAAWEQALTWYEPGTYSHNSVSRALAGAYEVMEIRRKDESV